VTPEGPAIVILFANSGWNSFANRAWPGSSRCSIRDVEQNGGNHRPSREREQSRYRVLVICNDSDYFLRHRLYLVTHLASVGVDVTVITGGPPVAAERIQGWEYVHLRMERFRFDPIGDIALAAHTARAIRSLKPDAVHLITLKPAIFSGLASVVSRFFHGYPKRILITLPGLGRMMSWSKGSGERRYPVGRASRF